MEGQEKPLLLRVGLIGASLPLLIIMVCGAWATIPNENGVVYVLPEQVAFFVVLYLSVPIGLFCLIVTQRVYIVRGASRGALAWGVFLGASNLLLGAVAWLLMFMMMEFASHHGG